MTCYSARQTLMSAGFKKKSRKAIWSIAGELRMSFARRNTSATS